MPDKPPNLEIRMPSGNIGRVTFKVHGDALAAGIMWKTTPTPEAIQVADAVITSLIGPNIGPGTQVIRAGYQGRATQAEQEQTLNRFVKSGDN